MIPKPQPPNNCFVDRRGKNRRVVRKPHWLKRVPAGTSVDVEIHDVVPDPPLGAWILVGRPRGHLTYVWVPNPYRDKE